MKRAIAAAIAGVVVGAVGAYAVLDRQHRPETPRKIVRDIGAVSKMSEADAVAHRAERYADLQTVSEVLTLPSQFARAEALYALAGRSDSGAVQRLIDEAGRIADAVDRNGALDILFLRLTELDPRSALAMSRAAPFASDRGIESAIWRTWARLDLEAALAAADEQSGTHHRNLAAQALFSAHGYMGNETTERIQAMLGIRPDRTTRSRYLYDLADRSPAEAISYVNNMRSGMEQRETLSWLAQYLSRNDPGQAAGYAALFDDPDVQRTYSQIVAHASAAYEPEAVLDQLVGGQRERMEDSHIFGAMRELAARDVDAAIAYAEQLPSPRDRTQFNTLIVEELARRDPRRALEWVRGLDDDSARTELLEQALRRIAVSDPQLAMTEARNIRHGPRRDSAVSVIARSVAASDPDQAVHMLEEISSQSNRSFAAASVLSKWAQRDPDAAIHWVLNTDIVDSKSLLQRLGRRLIAMDPETAIAVLPRLDEATASEWRRWIVESRAATVSAASAQDLVDQFEGTEDYDKLRAALVTGLARNDVIAAKQLADQLPAGIDRDKAYIRVIENHAGTDPGEAAAWLGSITDPASRSEATTSVVRTWFEQHPEQVRRWVENLPRGAQRDDAIVALASSWSEITPSRRLLIDSIGDSAKKNRAEIAQIGIVARTDWQKAQTMLDDAELSARERQSLQSHIDRHRGQ